jgi:hypothetical protein
MSAPTEAARSELYATLIEGGMIARRGNLRLRMQRPSLPGRRSRALPDGEALMAWYGRKLKHAQPVAERFWSKVDRRGAEDCWPWTARRDGCGYGTFKVDGKTVRASRQAWALTHGDLGAGQRVCHSCDNPPCCNPAHLWAGTQKDNVLDMVAKGRHWTQRGTVCRNGHPRTDDNTAWRKGRRGQIRECRLCKQAGMQRWIEKRNPMTPYRTKERKHHG